MLDGLRRLVVFRADGGRVLVRLAVAECEVHASGINLDADLTLAAVSGLFAVLRLTHVTGWRWAVVAAPLWGLVLLTAASAGIALTMDAIRRPEGGPGA